MTALEKLIKLKLISSTNEKVEFIKENINDSDFIKIMQFLVDDLVVTYLSRAKLNKSVDRNIGKEIILNDSAFINYLSTKCTGKDVDIANVQNYINNALNHTIEDIEILEGLACKDLSVGVSVKLFNKAVPKSLQVETVKYMGAITYDENKLDKLLKEDDVVAQLKADGTYVNTFINNGKVSFVTRNGQPLFINGKLREELESLSTQKIMCGELLLEGYGSDRRSEANGVIRGLISSNKKIEDGDIKEYTKFKKKYGMTIEEVENLIYIKSWDCLNSYEDTRSYADRFYDLTHSIILKTTKVRLIESKVVTNKQEIMDYFSHALTLGEEGLIIKSISEPFVNSKPNYQIKMKLTFQCELKIVDFVSGAVNSKYENTLGALLVESEDGLLKTKLSGMSDEQRDEIWHNKEKYVNKIVEVECSGISKARDSEIYSMFFPRFVEFRFDKDVADNYEDIKNIQDSILNLKEGGI